MMKVSTLEPAITFDWAKVLEDASIAKKVSSESWARSFIKEIKDYGKLNQIGTGETEILGLKIDINQGILKEGYPSSIGKSYFELKLVDTGTRIRVYDDNIITVSNKGTFDRLNVEKLEEDSVPLMIFMGTGPDGKTNPGTRLTTIFMRDHLEKFGFHDEFTVGQQTEKFFKVKGTVKDKGVSNDGAYVTIRYEANTGRGIIVRDVRISSDGATVKERSIVDVKTGEDGSVYLYYKQGDHVSRTPIKLPDTIMNQGELVKADYLPTRFDYNAIVGKTGAADLFEGLDIKSSKDYTRRVAYATQAGNEKAFDAEYGKGKCEDLWKAADAYSKSAAEDALRNMGLRVKEVKSTGGVRPYQTDEDILITTQDGIELKLDIEYAGEKGYSKQTRNMAKKFREAKADLGFIFWEGEHHVFINSAFKD